MAKKITFQCAACQQVVEIAPEFVARAMQEADDDETKDILVTCRDRHLNRVTVDAKKGVLRKVESGRVPV